MRKKHTKPNAHNLRIRKKLVVRRRKVGQKDETPRQIKSQIVLENCGVGKLAEIFKQKLIDLVELASHVNKNPLILDADLPNSSLVNFQIGAVPAPLVAV